MSDTPNPPPSGAGTSGDDDKGPVPYDRFAAARRELAAARTELDAVKATAASVTADRDAAAARAVAAEQAAATHAQELERYRAAVGAGITDPDVYEATKWAYDRMPAADRPEFGAALATWRAEPAKAPAVLRPWFGSAPATPGATTPASPPPTGDPAPPGGKSPAPPAYTPDVVARILAEGKYAEHRSGIAEAMRGSTGRR